MIYYLAAAYTEIEDKDEHMRNIMSFALKYMADHPDVHIVSPLFYHFGLKDNNVSGSYSYWKLYSWDLIHHCDGVIIYKDPFGAWERSIGVQDERFIAAAIKLKEIS